MSMNKPPVVPIPEIALSIEGGELPRDFVGDWVWVTADDGEEVMIRVEDWKRVRKMMH